MEAKTEKETFTPVGEAGLGRSSISEFFRRYKTDNMYCVSEVCFSYLLLQFTLDSSMKLSQNMLGLSMLKFCMNNSFFIPYTLLFQSYLVNISFEPLKIFEPGVNSLT